jgi:hypothetical protein
VCGAWLRSNKLSQLWVFAFGEGRTNESLERPTSETRARSSLSILTHSLKLEGDSVLYGFENYASVTPPVLCCDRWLHSFEAFVKDMGKRPFGTTLGRYLDAGNYEPGNVAWMSMMEQSAERSGKKAYLRLHKIHLKTKMPTGQLALNHRAVMQSLRHEAWRLGKGTDGMKQHAIATLFLNKLPDRNRRMDFFKAHDEVRRLAEEAESQVPAVSPEQ